MILGCGGYTPTGGEIVFEGRSINAVRLYERAQLDITLCWQEPARVEGISVARLCQSWKGVHRHSIDQKQLETLMAHGLTPEEAVEIVVAGLLR